MTMTASAPRLPLGRRMFYSIPIIGWLAKDIPRDINMVFYALIIAATVLVFAVQAWGLAALTLTALAMVPLMFLFFVAISLP